MVLDEARSIEAWGHAEQANECCDERDSLAGHVGRGVSASIHLARASVEERRWRERVRHLCTMRKKKAVQFVKKTLGSAETWKCFVCQKTGHLAKECPDIKKSKKEEALVAMESLDNENDWKSDADDFGTF